MVFGVKGIVFYTFIGKIILKSKESVSFYLYVRILEVIVLF